MYERMLDKQNEPSFDDLINYCGERGDLMLQLNKYLEDTYSMKKLIRFPYGKDYGWGVKYSLKSKHICDVFAENNAFTVFLRMGNDDFNSIKDDLTEYSKSVWDSKYPCGNGGWIRYRVLSDEHLADVERIIDVKAVSKKAN